MIKIAFLGRAVRGFRPSGTPSGRYHPYRKVIHGIIIHETIRRNFCQHLHHIKPCEISIALSEASLSVKSEAVSKFCVSQVSNSDIYSLPYNTSQVFCL